MSLIPLFLGGAFFFIIKLANIGVRLSDTNVYYYTGLKLLEGKILYKDIFFTNLPLFPYLTSFYLFISGKNIFFYYFTSTLEVLSISTLLYFISKHISKKESIAVGAALLYLFSFIVLSTTDHQTGVFLASLFAVLGYYFFLKKNNFIAGVFIGIALSLKAYFVPAAATFFIYFLFEKKVNDLIAFLKGFVLVLVVVIAPFLLLARDAFITQTFGYSLSRLAGLSKVEVIGFFINRDFLLFVLFIFNIFNYKQNKFFSIFSLLSIAFILIYKDIYYLYLNFVIPYTIISLAYIYTYIEKFKVKKFEAIFLPAIIIISVFNLTRYINGFQNLGKVSDLDQLTSAIQKENPTHLYGVDSLTPALAGLTKKPLVGDIIDTNENIFRAGILDKKKMTKEAIGQKTIIVARGISYPQFEIDEPLAEGILAKEAVNQKCNLLASQPIQAEGAVNRINLLKCY